MFTDYTLQEMRAVQEKAMPERVTIQRPQPVDDGFGGVTYGAPATVASDVPARITEAQMQVMYGQAARDLEIEKYNVRVPYGTDLQDEDLVVWGSLTLQVEDVKSRSFQTVLTGKAEVLK